MSHPARVPPDYDGHFVMIPLTKGKFAIVDEADAGIVLSGGPWTASAAGGSGSRTWYAVRRVPMHWVIAGRKWLDHVNRNGLDNRRINLRPATRSQNAANRALFRNNTSGYKGVCWNKNSRKWQAAIDVNNRTVHLGMFTDPVEAARAYNRAALEAFGEYAWLNPLPDAA